MAINKALRRNPGSGPGAPGAPGGPGAQGINPLAVVPQPADVRLMGSLPAIFLGNRAEAEHFINGVQAYIWLNREVPAAMQQARTDPGTKCICTQIVITHKRMHQ